MDVAEYNRQYKMIVDKNQELQQYKCEMEMQIIDLRKQVAEFRSVNIGMLEDRKYDRKRLVKMSKERFDAQTEVERLQKRVEELGDSLYNKDPDLASRIYDVTPSWAKDEE